MKLIDVNFNPDEKAFIVTLSLSHDEVTDIIGVISAIENKKMEEKADADT